MSKDQFGKVAQDIYKDRLKHEKQIRELCTNDQICSFQEFIKGFEEVVDAKEFEAKSDSTKGSCTIETFKEIFQSFEKYPPNLHKPKKHIIKDLNRTMAASRSQSMCDVNTSHGSSTFSLDKLTPIHEKWDNGPSVTEIYKDFRKFKKNLKMLEDLQKDNVEAKFLSKLQKINILAKEINKIFADKNDDIEIAFTQKDTERMNQFTMNLEKALFVHENQDLFKNDEETIQNLDNVIELLDYWFEAISQFHEN